MGWSSGLFRTGPLDALDAPFFSSSSCLDLEVRAEGNIPDAMRHNWRTSRLDWVQVEAKNRCPEDVSFDVVFNVEKAFPVGRERDTFGIPCPGEPCESPQTISVPACHLRADECDAAGVVLEQLDPRLDLDLSAWNQEEDTLYVEFSVHVVENRPRERAGGLFGLLFNGRGEPREPFRVAVQLRPRTTYLWEWELVKNPRPAGNPVVVEAPNPREAALASLAVWAITKPSDRRDFAEQWPVDDSLDEWMRRVYDELLSSGGTLGPPSVGRFGVRTGEDQLPPLDGDIVIDAPETVLAERQGSPIEIALLVATLASSAIKEEDRNDQIIVMMAPRSVQQTGTDVFVGWVDAEYPDELRAFLPADVGLKDFQQAKEEVGLSDLLLRRILAEVTCSECDGVYVDEEDERIAAVNVMRAASHYGLTMPAP